VSAHPSPAASPWWQRTLAAVRAALPRGGALPDESWAARHRGICVLLWLHVLALPVIGMVRGHTPLQALSETAVVAACAVGALLPRLGRTSRSLLATLGLLFSSAILVDFFDGLIELHFHFFVTVAVVALYQAWRPYLLALAFVAFHHAVLGTLAPHQVYNHHSAEHHPWLFALVHAGFILAESVACLVYWRVTEDALDGERAARAQLEKAHDDLEQAQELSGIGSWDWNVATDTMSWSDQHYVLAGVDPLTFRPSVPAFLALVHPGDRDRVAALVTAAIADRLGLDAGFRLVRPDGEVRHVHVLGEWVDAVAGAPSRLLGTSHDVTERKRLQDEIEHLAFHDPLTGLPNRRLFLDRLGHALARAERADRGCAVLFLDLDGFKTVNDTLGHRAGDELLCEVGRRLTAAARTGDTVSRLGGDEFALLCERVDLGEAGRVAARIREQLHQPAAVQGAEVGLRGSVGIAMAEAGMTAEDILRDADAAMYAVKSGGRDAHTVFPAGAQDV
jgi:diguanylate cyclase (GGDEF)-like protein